LADNGFSDGVYFFSTSKWQRMQWLSEIMRRSGSVSLQIGWQYGQRAWNLHPGGNWVGRGTMPGMVNSLS
jgi:hypothetical protein